MHFLKSASALLCLALLTSCEDPGSVGVRGVQPTLEQLNITSNTAAQNLLVNDLIIKAGLTRTPGPRDPDWSVVTEAGIYEIGRQCDQYLDVLFRFNRRQQAVRQGLTAVGAATATVLGLAGVAAPPIAITAAAFGLSASLFDAGVNSVLFTIEPSALRNVVLRGRKGYIDSLDLSRIDSRPRMMIALQGYLAQCSPAAIEANVNNAASGAESVASTNPAVAARAAGLAAPAATLIERADRTAAATVTTTPVPIADPLMARNRALPDEQNLLKRQAEAAQAALGVPLIDGNMGPDGAASETRKAIAEFERGLQRRAPSAWPARPRPTLGGNVGQLLTQIGSRPTIFKSPFERAYFGNDTGPLAQQYARPDLTMLNGFLIRLDRNAPWQRDGADAVTNNLDLMRKKLGEMKGSATPLPLTSALYDEVMK